MMKQSLTVPDMKHSLTVRQLAWTVTGLVDMNSDDSGKQITVISTRGMKLKLPYVSTDTVQSHATDPP